MRCQRLRSRRLRKLPLRKLRHPHLKARRFKLRGAGRARAIALITPVVQARQILPRSGSGEPELQRGATMDRRMARDRPSPYGEGTASPTVARGPVPRDRCVARDRPSPYGKKRPCRVHGMARDRPSPYGKIALSRPWDGEGRARAIALITPVVQARQILPRSGSGEPELQRGAVVP